MSYQIVCSGEMGDLIRRFRWEDTPLGAIELWPDELTTTLNMLLASRCPMILWWGSQRIQFYNDACRLSLCEDKHPRALGKSAQECWREDWPLIGPEFEQVMASGKSNWQQNRLIPVSRGGRMQEAFWTYSCSPVCDREGRARGVLGVCNETTEQVLNERRLRTMLAIDKHGFSPVALDELGALLVERLSVNPADIPFALLYSVESAASVRLLGATGFKGDPGDVVALLPILEVATSSEPRQVSDLAGPLRDLACGPWPEPVPSVFVQPAGTLFRSRCVLVLGASPRLPFDANYRNFFHLVGNKICDLMENEARLQEHREAKEQRVKLFEEINQQHDLLASIVENAPACIAVFDPDLRVKWCNPFFGRLFDATALDGRQLIGQKISEIVPHSEEIVKIMEQVRDTHQTFTSAEFEHSGFARGMTYWQWSVVRLATGDILNVSADVTEQVRARHKVEAFGERLHLAQKAARLGTYDWHLPTGQLEWSPEFYDATGFDPSVQPDWQFYFRQVDPQDRPRLRHELQTLAHEGDTLRVHDHRLAGSSGEERWAALTGYLHRGPTGRPERVIGTVCDITSRKLAEKAGEKSRKEAQQQWAELEAIYGTAPIGLALFDPVEFRYLRLNSRQAEIVGLPAEKILGRTLTEIAPIQGLREMFEQVARGTPVINALLEGELPMSPGEHRYWTVNYFPVYDADGSIQAISAASLEITAQKRAELALIQSEKIAAVGRLASSISHEINNPLEAVTNLLFLLGTEDLSPAGREYLAVAERELMRVSQIATHTLRFHRQSTRANEAGAAEMIDPILALYQGRLTSAEILVQKQYRTEFKVLCFDGEIRQVVNNLIGNSIDAMWRGGRLILRTQRATDWQSGQRGLRITIADTGAGMSDVTKRRLFEAFYTTKGLKGTGLGLWISEEIVRKHGGRLRFRSSQSEAHSGTVFQLFLPLAPVFQMQPEAVRTEPIDPSLKKVV